MERPKPTDRETKWSAYLAQKSNGVAEYRTFDGSRVDVLTETHAIEVEWIKKWQEAIGQSLFYAAATNTKPGIMLLARGHKHEELYYLRCLAVCRVAGIDLWIMQTNKEPKQ